MNVSKEKLKQIYKFISKNKYWLTIAVFAISILFVHQNNIFKLVEHNNELKDLRRQEQYLQTKIMQDSIKLNELSTNVESLEKFAREQYFFHKKNEEVFVIERVSK